MTSKRTAGRARPRLAASALCVFLAVGGMLISGCTSTNGTAPPAQAAEPAPTMVEQWGVEVVALRLTGADYMLDFRYKVIDADKAGELFERTNKPVLIHNATGAKLEVPRPAKTGPLRPTNPPQAGRVYFMLFSNPGVVKAGDEVTIEIGDFKTDVVVE